MEMYLFFDRIGNLKEIVNGTPFRVGNSNVNKLYIYLEGMEDNDTEVAWIRYRLPDGTSTTETYIPTKTISEIPYDKARDLRFFQYFKEYPFFVETVPDIVLSQSGTVAASIRIVDDATETTATITADNSSYSAPTYYWSYTYSNAVSGTIGASVSDFNGVSKSNINITTGGKVLYVTVSNATSGWYVKLNVGYQKSDSSIIECGLLTFNVEYSVSEDVYHLEYDGYVSLSQYNYLLKQISDIQLSTGTLYKTEVVSSTLLGNLTENDSLELALTDEQYAGLISSTRSQLIVKHSTSFRYTFKYGRFQTGVYTIYCYEGKICYIGVLGGSSGSRKITITKTILATDVDIDNLKEGTMTFVRYNASGKTIADLVTYLDDGANIVHSFWLEGIDQPARYIGGVFKVTRNGQTVYDLELERVGSGPASAQDRWVARSLTGNELINDVLQRTSTYFKPYALQSYVDDNFLAKFSSGITNSTTLLQLEEIIGSEPCYIYNSSQQSWYLCKLFNANHYYYFEFEEVGLSMNNATYSNRYEGAAGESTTLGIILTPSSNYYQPYTTKAYVDNKISQAISGVYQLKGSATVSQLNTLTSTTVDKSTLNGFVYNVTTSGNLNYYAGTTPVLAGDNVVFVYNNGQWGWDKLASTVDLSGYVQKTTTIASIDLQDNISAQELTDALVYATDSDVEGIMED